MVPTAPGFHAWGADQMFLIGRAGELCELGSGLTREPALPAGAEPFEHELPSMPLRQAACRGLSATAVHLPDEHRWGGQLRRARHVTAAAELALAGLVEAVRQAVSGSPLGERYA